MTFLLLSTDPTVKSETEPTVPDIYVALGNDSIKAVTQNLTWDDARKHCEGDNANLASLRNDWTQAYVELLAMSLKAPLWIGLNKEKVQSCNPHNKITLAKKTGLFQGRQLKQKQILYNCYLLINFPSISMDHVMLRNNV